MKLSGKFLFPICLTFVLLITSVSHAAPSAKLWERWDRHDAESSKTINHQVWDEILKRNVVLHYSGVNRFRYSNVDEADKSKLNSYIQALADTPISSYNRNQQLAYWINLYNALTVKVILDAYPVESIRDISSGLFTSGPWKLELVEIEGEQLTLDDVEHRILRPIWKDPRIHYAVNCASIGCPNLQRDAFTVENSEALMDKAARDFINHPRAAAVKNGKLTVSSIYDWFDEDFGGNDAGVIAHLKQYAEQPLLDSLQSVKKISNDTYDWNLNGYKASKTKPAGRKKGGS